MQTYAITYVYIYIYVYAYHMLLPDHASNATWPVPSIIFAIPKSPAAAHKMGLADLGLRRERCSEYCRGLNNYLQYFRGSLL